MSNIKVKKCEACGHEIYDLGKGMEGHWWGCRMRAHVEVMEDMARKIDDLCYHLGLL